MPETGLAPKSKTLPHLSCRDGVREGRVRTGAPKGRTAAVSNRFALIPHFTTTKIISDSYWKSLVFLFGLTVPSARPARKTELATDLQKFQTFWINQYKCLRDYHNFPSNGSCPLTRKEIFSSLQQPVDFKKNLIALFLQSKYRAITRGQLCSPLFWNLVSNKCLQMPPAKGFWYSAHLWDCIPCFFHLMWVFLILQVSHSNFVSFSTLVGQNRLNNFTFLFKKEAGGF